MDEQGADALAALRRTRTQQRILLLLVSNDREMSTQEVASALGLGMNAINIALHNMHQKGLVDRVSRGVYKFKLGPILSSILSKHLRGE